MKIWYASNGLRASTDLSSDYSGSTGIEIRGSSSQMFPQKQFGFELWDLSGDGIKAALFGMPSEEDWIINAPYTDKTLIRNHLAYTTSNLIGRYAPRTDFCEVFINQPEDGTSETVYAGVYVFMEKIKKATGRVNIKKLSSSDVSEPTITGGYIIKVDRVKEDDGYFDTDNQTRIVYEYPKVEDINTAQTDYLKKYFNDFESALKSSDFTDVNNGYAKFIDTDTFVDFLILNELFKNVDGFRLSAFMNKDRGGKLKMGPVWDFNVAMGNANYYNGNLYTGWQMDEVQSDDEFQVPFWWKRLRQDPAFIEKISVRWNALRDGSLSETSLMKIIDDAALKLNESQKRNYEKWKILGKYVWPNPEPFPATYQEEISTLKTWLKNRLNWMDNNIKTLKVN
jgi:hypothetical protein